jgi:cytochrome c peroxidase
LPLHIRWLPMNTRFHLSIFPLRLSCRTGETVVLAMAAMALSACDHSANSGASISPLAVSAAPLAVTTQSLIANGALKRLTAPVEPLSAMAQLGRRIFFDASLSASGKLSCASCHNPDNAYSPSNYLAVQFGGEDMRHQGGRAVPSLRYHEHTPHFSIGPDLNDTEVETPALATTPATAVQASLPSVAKATLSGNPAPAMQENVPQGGFTWDGRAQGLAVQAGGPLLDPNEMANQNPATLVNKLKAASYANEMRLLFGPGVFSSPSIALGEAYFALASFQKEDRSFHPYDSKYDYYLAEKVQLSDQEMRGLKLFKDVKKGNCATCHIEKPSRDGLIAPVFTDYQFEALAVPRNLAISANHDPHYFDLGMCGPWRKDYVKQQNYCGYFKTPTLRNVATRQVFFHNGVFHSLDEVLHFYVQRETRPEKWYPRTADGKINKYDDLPLANRANVDLTDAPFDRKAADAPALNDEEIKDVIAFLKTLNDGYRQETEKTAGN